MRKALSVGALFIAFAAYHAGAQDFSVSYLEGDAQVRTGSSWAALSIGDKIGANATIQLGDRAYIEIQRAGTKLTLTQKGTYALADVLASSRTLGSAGVSKALSSTLSYLLKGPVKNQSSVAGARGADQSGSDEDQWVTSSAQVDLDAGKLSLTSGKYDQAIKSLLQALDVAEVEEEPEIRYYLASAYSLSGDTRAALKYAAGLHPGGTDAWANDFVILKASLLVDTSAWTESIGWLTQKGNDLSGDAQRADVYNFLLGVAYRGVGDAANAKARLTKVVAISADSDLGKAAKQLLLNP